jgi:hypothetical protein
MTLRQPLKVFLFTIGMVFLPLLADAASDAQNATVKTDSAIVYANANFESQALTYLSAGKKVRISRKIYGDYFKFYKIKVSAKQIGYIATIDVTTEAQSKKDRSQEAAADRERRKQDRDDEEHERRSKRESVWETRYAGILIGRTNFKESIAGVAAAANVTTYGVKITGPDLLIEGPVMDLNFAFHYGAPDYYNGISTTSSTGYLFLIDTSLMVPLAQGFDWAGYFSVGPFLKYSDFKMTSAVAGGIDAAELSLGAAFGVGGVYRYKKLAARVEYKYYLERSSYSTVQLAFQTQF